MLVPLQEKDFDKYVNFAYELAVDPLRSGYPAFFDGVKTKEFFIARSMKTKPGEEILLYEADGEVEGWLHYRYQEEERCVSTCTCCIRRNTGEALSELLDYLTARYPGCDWSMGFSAKNRERETWCENNGFRKLEDSNYYMLLFDQYAPVPDPTGVERVTEENFEKFQRIHEKIQGDMYWNVQRVRREINSWDLFVAEEDGVVGEAMALDEGDGWYEIFALECEDGKFHENLFRKLLARVLNEGKRKGAKYFPFFIDPEDEENRILPEMGFRLIDRYVAYLKKI